MMRRPNIVVAGAMWHPSYLCDDEPDSPDLTASDLEGGGLLQVPVGVTTTQGDEPDVTHAACIAVRNASRTSTAATLSFGRPSASPILGEVRSQRARCTQRVWTC